jgi:hypothetical protein
MSAVRAAAMMSLSGEERVWKRSESGLAASRAGSGRAGLNRLGSVEQNRASWAWVYVVPGRADGESRGKS